MSLRDNFLNSIALTVINKPGKGGVIQISTVCVPSYMLLLEKSPESGLFRDLINNVLQSP